MPAGQGYGGLNRIQDLANLAIETNRAKREYQLMSYRNKPVIKGDFEGSVTGYWVRMDASGAGIVSYQRKEYVCEPIGFVSLPKNTPVELTFAHGIYYAKF